MSTPIIGQKVRALNIPGAENYNGLVCTVTDINHYVDWTEIRGEFKSLMKPDDTINLVFRDWEPIRDTNPPVAVGDKVKALTVTAVPTAEGRICTVLYVPTGGGDLLCAFDEYVHDGHTYEATSWYVSSWTLDLSTQEPEPQDADVAELQRKIDGLVRNLEEARRDRDNLRTRAAAYAEDFDTVGTMLLEEAERRGWCSDYDEFVDTVNGKLGMLSLPEREQEYEVEVTVTGTLTTTTTVTVMARSQEDADTIVEENMDEYVDAEDILTDAARSASFDDIQCEVE